MIPLFFVGLGLLALAAGCGEEEPEDSCGLEDGSCDGKASRRTNILFQDGYASADEQREIRERIESWERPLRGSFPDLFCHFNGWEVTSETPEGDVAQYNSTSRTTQVQKDLGAWVHEFCHYI